MLITNIVLPQMCMIVVKPVLSSHCAVLVFLLFALLNIFPLENVRKNVFDAKKNPSGASSAGQCLVVSCTCPTSGSWAILLSVQTGYQGAQSSINALHA